MTLYSNERVDDVIPSQFSIKESYTEMTTNLIFHAMTGNQLKLAL